MIRLIASYFESDRRPKSRIVLRNVFWVAFSAIFSFRGDRVLYFKSKT